MQSYVMPSRNVARFSALVLFQQNGNAPHGTSTWRIISFSMSFKGLSQSNDGVCSGAFQNTAIAIAPSGSIPIPGWIQPKHSRS